MSGSTVKFPGYMTLFSQHQDKNEKDSQTLPDVKEGTPLKTLKIIPKQHFTKPPPRFSEATLVKELEKNGIGRPSTYATILTVIRDKGYVDLIKRYFVPSELGFIVNDLLVSCFPNILNISFTAQMENNLDDVEKGSLEEVQLLTDFYSSFKKSLDAAGEDMISVKGVGVPTGLTCPSCGKQLNIKIGRNGHFLACTGYPDCSFTSNYLRDEKGEVSIVEKIIDNTKVKDCIKCGEPMVQKEGRFGMFLACTGYPDCKHTESVNGGQSGKDIGVKCPEANCSGTIIERKSRRGKIFFGCSNYPNCTFASWDKPVDRPCPDCNSPYLVEKKTKREGKFLKCPNKDCGFKEHQ